MGEMTSDCLQNFLTDHLITQDEDILILNKPAGLLSVPGRGPELMDSVLTRLQRIDPRVLLIHRLDRDTSGVMVFALNRQSQRHVSIAFQQRKTEKSYTALVMGHWLDAPSRIDIPVRYDDTRPPLHIADAAYDKPALTYLTVLAHEQLAGEPVTRVQLRPVTGRAHQLRVHLQWADHPIIGDTLYASGQGRELMPRLCLHATELGFVHPRTGQSVRFSAPVPF